MPEWGKVLTKALCIAAEDGHCETEPWESMAKLVGKAWEKSKAIRHWERLHTAQAQACPQPWGKIKYLVYNFPLEKGAPGFLPCSTLTVSEVPCHNQKPCSQELDRYDSLQHLSMQLLNPNLTPGINTHWHLGKIHITYYFIKNRTNFSVKRALVKRWNRNHPAKSLK